MRSVGLFTKYYTVYTVVMAMKAFYFAKKAKGCKFTLGIIGNILTFQLFHWQWGTTIPAFSMKLEKNKTNLTIYLQRLVSSTVLLNEPLLPWNPHMQNCQDVPAPCDPAHSRGNKSATDRCSSWASQLSNRRTNPRGRRHCATITPQSYLCGSINTTADVSFFHWCNLFNFMDKIWQTTKGLMQQL